MKNSFFSMSKLKLFILLFLIIISSYLTLDLSHEAKNIALMDERGHYTNYQVYLDLENYILMGILIILSLYFIICILKEENYRRFFLSYNIILFILLIPLAYLFTSYRDIVGLHIDRFLGVIIISLGIINLIVFSIRFLVKKN